MRREEVVYVVYSGDEVVAIGSLEECSAALGCMASRIQWLASPAAHRRNKSGRRMVAERVRVDP